MPNTHLLIKRKVAYVYLAGALEYWWCQPSVCAVVIYFDFGLHLILGSIVIFISANWRRKQETQKLYPELHVLASKWRDWCLEKVCCCFGGWYVTLRCGFINHSYYILTCCKDRCQVSRFLWDRHWFLECLHFRSRSSATRDWPISKWKDTCVSFSL